ncbi:two-component system response regulator CreB [Undibacterium sp. TJN19]|uniref:two-component system response regulator CreB n=1 Tax=Undibacterium sp. TJN19 TaxID=3413055 RepID=UPI003BEFAAED
MLKTILIVEDEVSIAENLAYALSTDGFHPLHVSLGQSALSLLRDSANESANNPASASPPALVVLDIGLPDMSGFDVCRQLRQFSDVPVIFLTARNDEIDRIVGLEIGADDYVSKPFSPREMVARIRAILRRQDKAAQMHAATPATTRSILRLELRADEARILYYGQALTLTRYEYLLLKTLMERPGQLFSRAQLMEIVWVNAPETLERTVDAHIKSLRAKLRQARLSHQGNANGTASEDSNDEGIQTHRGMGYSLTPT